MPKKSRFLLLPALSATLAYGLAYLVSSVIFSVTILPLGIARDFPFILALSYLIFFLSRSIWAFIALQWLMIAVLYIGNAAKLAFFGGPMVPDDVYALRSLLLITMAGNGCWSQGPLPVSPDCCSSTFTSNVVAPG